MFILDDNVGFGDSNIFPNSAPVGWDSFNLPASSSSPPMDTNPTNSGNNSAILTGRFRLDSDIGPSLSAAASQTLSKLQNMIPNNSFHFIPITYFDQYIIQK